MHENTQFIALIGAPGAQKTGLALELQAALDNVAIVDGYPEAVEESADLALGKFGTYFGNLAVMVARVAAERKALSAKPDYVVTCGTHIESLVYEAILAAVEEKSRPLEDQYMTRISVIMRFFGMMASDFFAYDHIFFLPTLGNPDDAEDTFPSKIEGEILLGIQAFGVEVDHLSQDPAERLTQVLDFLKEAKNEHQNQTTSTVD